MNRSKRFLEVLGPALMLVASARFAIAQRPPAGALVPTTTRRPDEFGTQNYTVTVIPAESFTSDTPSTTYYGWLGRNHAEPGHFFAGVNIPSGAVIDFVGVEASVGGDLEFITTLFYVDRYSGTTSGIVNVGSALPNAGLHTDYNASPLGWQLVQNAHNALVLDVFQAVAREFASPVFRWVEIWWHRTVSPPPATATFGDVPTDHPFFQFVEAIAAAGITAGCGGGNFCPDQPITRKQEAAFIAKALGLHWPN